MHETTEKRGREKSIKHISINDEKTNYVENS